jgi:hypothetical protein
MGGQADSQTESKRRFAGQSSSNVLWLCHLHDATFRALPSSERLLVAAVQQGGVDERTIQKYER